MAAQYLGDSTAQQSVMNSLFTASAGRPGPRERAHGSSAVPGGVDRRPGHASGRGASRRPVKWGNSPIRAIWPAMHAICAS